MTNSETLATITEKEILAAQKAWGEGIVKIGTVFQENGDYQAAATEHINEFYNYKEGEVLFKPTLVSAKQFRKNFEGALSYFIGGNKSFSEDHGFAIKPWSAVRWENIGTKIIGNMAVAMGNYYFTPVAGGDDVKVEYSFAYTKNSQGELKIILHDSHIPYSPVAAS
ncbi:phosphoribosyl-AMP cyclohydrolase [Aquimarina hainanensis]|uniref:Phosphoribosyl-AMP cyclohydrolase n=2 Tax=Flavobacteriaceae TaxID=49546 RepID=A0ABW5NEK1_9FLAO